jgi:lipoyl-dependent peroxiredoxin
MYLNRCSGKSAENPLHTLPPSATRRRQQGGATMQSRATAQWEGDLMSGKGKISAASGTFRDAGLSWKARTEGAASNTTPEELLAAAHASCFSMALSNGLAKEGHAPRRLDTTCTVEFGPKQGGGFEVKSSALEVRGQVPGIDQAAFQKAAEAAKNGCPISSALKIQMSVKATLQG